MDLQLTDARATVEERAAVDALLGPPETPWDGGERDAYGVRVSRTGREAREQRHLLLPALHAVQDRIGWISEGALNYVSIRLTVPPAETFGVASFYALFALQERPPTVVHICDDIACGSSGAERLCGEMERLIGPAGTPTTDGGTTWQRSPCLGLCEQAPAALVQRAGIGVTDRSIGCARAEDVVAAITSRADEIGLGADVATIAPQTADESRSELRLLRRVGVVDPGSLDSYRAEGGYEALRMAVEMGPGGVIRELKDARLMGRGGAAFPTGVKWEAVASQASRPHYFICNADESEPGTFKDRVLMEHDPFALIESLTIAGYTTASEHGSIYIRGEYPLAQARLRHAIDEARERGYLGDDVMGEGFTFDIEVRRGAGAYICGEETALLNSIEGKRGEPRSKPPFPVSRGLFGKPTGINNVETLVNVLEILRIGGPAYAQIGTEGSTGPRLFCLSGTVERPGLYEVPFGATLRDLIELAGGVSGGRPLKAVLLGGAAGAFVRPQDLDLKLTFEDTRAAGVTLGSGVVMAFDDTVSLPEVLLRIAAFFRDESCGQCVPCRVGTVRQEEALQRIVRGAQIGSRDEELALLGEIAQVMRDASICGLGQTAANAVVSAIEQLGVFEGADTSNGSQDRSVPTRTEEQES
ncbi:MAG: NAD(P)H-dependent oxidoreductase subunit E [Actinomycetota bacterium]